MENGADKPENGADKTENGADAVENGADIVENGTEVVENGTDKSVSWLLSRQCGICQGLAEDGVSTPCCSSTACKPCALKHLESDRYYRTFSQITGLFTLINDY